MKVLKVFLIIIMLVSSFGLTMGYVIPNKVVERQEQRIIPVVEVTEVEATEVVVVEVEVAEVVVTEIAEQKVAAKAVVEAPVDHKIEAEEAYVEPVQEISENAPAAHYNYQNSNTYTFKSQVIITNTSNERASSINVTIPLLENNSPYQTTTLITDYHSAIAEFSLEAGESKTIELLYAVKVNSFKVSGSNDVITLAQSIFNKHKGNGNCRTLAQAFIAECQANGIQAREVVGFARPTRGNMTTGDLKGCRHSWAEFYVDGLGWIPADLAFGYFMEFPHTSHIIEGYGDRSIGVKYNGGQLSAIWNNIVM